MPGLAGVYDPGTDVAEISRILQRMRRIMDVPGFPSHADTIVDRGMGYLSLHRHSGTIDQPPIATEEGRNVWLALDGELYNGAELRAQAARNGRLSPQDSDARLCLSLHHSEGENFLRRLNGQFTLVMYRGSECRLTIATDRYGYRPLFTAQDGSRLLFATEIKAIIAALDTTPSFDPIGILELLLQGYALGARTWLEPIRVLDAGTLLDVTPTGTSRRRYFRLHFRSGQDMSATDFVEGLGSKLKGALERMTAPPDRIGVLLSGGLDSRSIVLAARRPPAAAFTFGDEESRDVRYARALAQIANVPHVHLPYDQGYLGRVLSPVVWRTEGLLPFASVTFTSMYFHRRIEPLADTLLYGHCGDVLTGAHLRPGVLVARSRSRLMDRVLRSQQLVDPEVIQRVVAPGFYRRHAADVRDVMRATFADIDQDALTDVADVWDMENRQRRGTFHSPAVDRYRFAVRAPFLDNDLVDHLLQAPLRWRFQQLAYKRMIVRHFPHAAEVPWAYTGRPIRTDLGRDLTDVTRNYVATRVRRWRGARPPDQCRDLAADLRADACIPTVLRTFVRRRWFPGEIFDRNGIEEVIRRHYDAREDLTHTIVMLATLATAFRLLLFECGDAIPPEAEPPV